MKHINENVLPDEASSECVARSPRDQTRFEALGKLTKQFSLSSAFVRVPKLSKMLSITATSIHSQMRSGIFPMPHRRVGNVIVVRIEDFVEWYCFGESVAAGRREARHEHEPDPATFVEEPPENEPTRDDELIVWAETPKERASRIKSELLASMKRRRAK